MGGVGARPTGMVGWVRSNWTTRARKKASPSSTPMKAGGEVCTQGRSSESSHHSSNGISNRKPPTVTCAPRRASRGAALARRSAPRARDLDGESARLGVEGPLHQADKLGEWSGAEDSLEARVWED